MRFYSPKNFKKGRHLGGMFRWIDIVLFGTATLLFIPAFLFNMTGDTVNIPLLMLTLLLYGIVIVLIQPFPPIYHNFLVFFYLQYLYLRRQKEYIWGGIVKYEEKEE